MWVVLTYLGYLGYVPALLAEATVDSHIWWGLLQLGIWDQSMRLFVQHNLWAV